MTRRELFLRLTGGLAAVAAAPIALDTVEVTPDPARTLAVLRFNGQLSTADKKHLKEAWDRAASDSAWSRVKVLVMDESVTLEVHKQ